MAQPPKPSTSASVETEALETQSEVAMQDPVWDNSGAEGYANQPVTENVLVDQVC